MEKLKQLMERLQKAQHDMGKVFEEAGPELDFSKVTCVAGSDAEKAAAVRKMNDDCATIQKEIEAHQQTLKAQQDFEARKNLGTVRHPEGGKTEKDPETMGFGAAFVKAGGHLPENRHKSIMLPESVNLKTAFTTAAGWAPESLRTGRLVDYATRPILAMDLVPMDQTKNAALKYMEETTFTNNAAERAESSGAYGENAFALTERSVTMESIGCFVPVTDEQLEDVSFVQGYLDRRLRFSLMQRLDYQLINGDGSTPNVQGILAKSSIQTMKKSDYANDLECDSIRRAMTKIRVTGRALASGVLMNPYDWDGIRLMKTTDGVYIWGPPSEADPERLWGIPVAQSDAIAQYTAMVGDFANFSAFVERRGIEVKVTDSHDTYFIYGKQAVRASIRGGFVWYRAAAFCKVTLNA